MKIIFAFEDGRLINYNISSSEKKKSYFKAYPDAWIVEVTRLYEGEPIESIRQRAERQYCLAMGKAKTQETEKGGDKMEKKTKVRVQMELAGSMIIKDFETQREADIYFSGIIDALTSVNQTMALSDFKINEVERPG